MDGIPPPQKKSTAFITIQDFSAGLLKLQGSLSKNISRIYLQLLENHQDCQ